MNERIKLVTQLATTAGKELNKIFHEETEIERDLKADTTFVTKQDTKTEQFLVSEILKKFPEDGFLGEEGTNNKGTSGYKWIIDPIDGTTNFIYRLPMFTVSIGLVKNNEIVGGVINVPILKQTYSVTKESGFCADFGRSNVSTTKKLNEAVCIYSLAHLPMLRQTNMAMYPHIFASVRKLRVLGSISYELVQVASGLVDLVVNVGSHPWDVAAGVIMVREAGGIVIDFSGKEWTFNSDTLIATTPFLKKETIEMIQRIFPDGLILPK